jgi:hypothetical protein
LLARRRSEFIIATDQRRMESDSGLALATPFCCNQ